MLTVIFEFMIHEKSTVYISLIPQILKSTNWALQTQISKFEYIHEYL